MAGVLPAFEGWMREQGIERSDAISLVAAAAGCSGLALGVRAVRDVGEGERLCTIPKAACLSIRTSELADVIEAEELGGGLGLVLAVLHERSLGASSKWHGYFAACPAREYLPLFWTDAQLELLQGTELAERVQADRQAAREDFEEHIAPLAERYPGRLRPGALTLHNFHTAASLVASRAFGVDEWHGDAMVPLADIFNHKASVVELGPEYAVHGADSSSSDEEDEEEAGSEQDEEGGGSSGGEEEEEEEAAAAGHCQGHSHAGSCCDGATGCSKQGRHSHEHEQQHGAEGSALPAVMAAGPASIYGLSSANGLHLRLQMGIVDRDEETLEIVAPSAVPAGQEVHNTYGELGNAELVKKYGFALRQNPFTAVALDKVALLEAARAALGAARWRARCKLLREQTEVLEEEEEPFEALPNGHISPPLFVALRVLCAPDEEAAAWGGIADALQPPPAAAAAADGEAKAAAGGSGSGSDSEEEDEGAHLGAVQVWPVLDADGQPLAAGSTAAAERQQLLQQGHAAMLSRGACELLQGAVQRRLAAYAGSLQADLEQLAELEAQEQGGAAAAAVAAADEADARVAHSAALLLRVTEKEVLQGLLTALERRLAALPPAQPEGGGKAKRKALAPAGKQAKQQAKQAKQGSGGRKARHK